MTDPVPQRIGDTDRDQAADALREHLAQGRISQDEFDERMSVALSAKTAADLEPLFADLPEPRPAALKGVEPMSTPWPAYNPPPPAVPAPRPAAEVPAVNSNWATGLMVAATVAWPAWLILSFAFSWRLWWLVWIPITISVLAGKFRSQTGQ
ncbi:MAG TPA: DUF1707 domain-containing protein [Microlunatus sp.]